MKKFEEVKKEETLVENYINDTFLNCDISDCPIFPKGKIITYGTSEKLLIYEDINYANQIVVIDPDSDFKQVMKRYLGQWLLVLSK